MIVNVLSFSAGEGRHVSYRPANRISPPSGRWNQVGRRSSFGPVHSKIRRPARHRVARQTPLGTPVIAGRSQPGR